VDFGGGPVGDQPASSLLGATAVIVASSRAAQSCAATHSRVRLTQPSTASVSSSSQREWRARICTRACGSGTCWTWLPRGAALSSPGPGQSTTRADERRRGHHASPGHTVFARCRSLGAGGVVALLRPQTSPTSVSPPQNHPARPLACTQMNACTAAAQSAWLKSPRSATPIAIANPSARPAIANAPHGHGRIRSRTSGSLVTGVAFLANPALAGHRRPPACHHGSA
jgi:hypothetical protein